MLVSPKTWWGCLKVIVVDTLNATVEFSIRYFKHNTVGYVRKCPPGGNIEKSLKLQNKAGAG